ncbi:MAG: hypothetical protein WCE68_00280 [Anaerolineales bacterium]
MKLLTFDTDWAVYPTPEQLMIGTEEEHQTLDALVYDFHLPNGRPHDDRHEPADDPDGLYWRLIEAGLPRRLKPHVTDWHREVLDVVRQTRMGADWKRQRVAEIVCLDAHLDIYPRMLVDLDTAHPGRAIYRVCVEDLASGLDRRAKSIPTEYRDRIRESYDWIRDGLMEGGWLISLAGQIGTVKVDWVVPYHFAAALDQGFPYPNAQWADSLALGKKYSQWSARAYPKTRTIKIASPRYQIVVQVMTSLPSLAEVDLVHLARSPLFLPPKMDVWVDYLVSLF